MCGQVVCCACVVCGAAAVMVLFGEQPVRRILKLSRRAEGVRKQKALCVLCVYPEKTWYPYVIET